MSNRIRLRAVAAISALSVGLTLGGCGWLGEEEAPPLPGERLSVMLLESDLEPDQRLADLEVRLPKPYLNSDWPQAGGYSDHAMHHLESAADLDEVWSSDIGDGGDDEERLLSAPIVVGDRVYTVDVDYQVSAFNAETGRAVWRLDVEIPDEDDDAFGGGLAYEGGVLFLSTGYAKLIAMKAADGAEIWRANVSAPMRAAPAVAKGVVLVTTVDNQSVAFDAKNGEQLWSHTGFSETAGMLGGSSAALNDDVAVVPYSSGEIFTIRAKNGRVNWNGTLTSLRRVDALSSLADIRGAPVIDRGIVYAVSQAGRMAAFDLRSGARIWERRVGSINTPWIAGDFLFVLANEGHLVAMTRRGGRVRWLTSLPIWEDPEDPVDPISWVGPVLAGDRLILGNSLGEVWAFSPYTGKALSRLDVDDPVRVAPVVAGGTIYVQTEGGRLIAFR